jgi:hypothetical protein
MIVTPFISGLQYVFSFRQGHGLLSLTACNASSEPGQILFHEFWGLPFRMQGDCRRKAAHIHQDFKEL